MFWNVLNLHRQVLLKRLTSSPPLPGSYLAGGTALALLYGHRESVDFDWFTPTGFDPGELAQVLEQFGSVRVAETSAGTFHGWIDEVQMSWLRYPNPMLRPLQEFPDAPGLKMASVVDIGLMKWAAVSDRGARKDFLDLYELNRNGVTMDELFPLLEQKFPQAAINHYHMVKSLAYFDDAEKDIPPVLLKPILWEDVKKQFRATHKRLLDRVRRGE